MQTPAYPFYTRYGTGQLTGWLSDTTCCDVRLAVPYALDAAITWTRQRYHGRNPDLSEVAGEVHDVLITRAEFLAAYHAADTFLVDAEKEFLQAAPVRYATAAQVAELQRLVENPLLDRRTKTRILLALPKLTTEEADSIISSLYDSIHAHAA